MSIQNTALDLRVGVSGVSCLLCPCNFDSLVVGGARCFVLSEQCLRQSSTFGFKDTVFGGAKTMSSVVGYVGVQRRVIVRRWARAVARWRVGVLVGDSEWSEGL